MPHGINEYLINKPGTAKLGIKSMSKNLLESFLVMIIPVMTRIIHATHIKHSIKPLQYLQNSDQSYKGPSKRKHKKPNGNKINYKNPIINHPI